MYGINNMHISVMQDALGMYPVVHQRVLPAWMSAEHYENCESGILFRIRSLLRK